MRKNSFIGDQVAADMHKTLNNDEFKRIFASPVTEASEEQYSEVLSEEPGRKAFMRFASKASGELVKTALNTMEVMSGGRKAANPDIWQFKGSYYHVNTVTNQVTPVSKEEDARLRFSDTNRADDKDDDDKDDKDEDKEDKKPKKGKQPPWLKKDKKDEDKKDDDKEDKKDEEDKEDKKDKDEKKEDDKDDCAAYAQAFDHIVETLIRTSEALEGMGLKVTAKQSLLLLDNIIEESAHQKFAHDEELSVTEDMPGEEEISLKERIEDLPEDLLAEPPALGEELGLESELEEPEIGPEGALEEGEELEEPLTGEEEEIAVAFKELKEWIKKS